VKTLIGALAVMLTTAHISQGGRPSIGNIGAYVFLNNRTTSQNVPRGWTGGVAGTVTPWLTIAGEVGDSYLPASATSNLTSLYSFLAGPRYVFRAGGRLSVFGQFLVGDVHAGSGVYSALASSNDLSYQPGGGVDIGVARRWGPTSRATTAPCGMLERRSTRRDSPPASCSARSRGSARGIPE
jgi:hypothetical protein